VWAKFRKLDREKREEILIPLRRKTPAEAERESAGTFSQL
jgi:hypothetical protein